MLHGTILNEPLDDHRPGSEAEGGMYVCFDCRTCLSGVKKRVCPGCGRPFDPRKRETMFQYLRRPVRVFRCEQLLAARIVTLLDDAGIPALVQHPGVSVVGSILGHLDQFHSYVVVDREDVADATALLRDPPVIDEELGPWDCPSCGESNEAGFEICWQCEGVHPEHPDAEERAP